MRSERQPAHNPTRLPATSEIPRPSFVDAFAGCGGLTLGLKRAGWNSLFAIEKDPFAFATLSANFLEAGSRYPFHWPLGVPARPWDINDLLQEHLATLATLSDKVDLLAGGPPCQGFSDAGRRQHDDPRNRLFEAYLNLVRILRPRLVLIENVRGFTSDFPAAETADTIQNFAAALNEGLQPDYDLNSRILRAVDFGVPQARPRYFLVGVAKSLSAATRVGGFFEDLQSDAHDFLQRRKLPPRPTARDAISDLEVDRNGTIPSPENDRFESIAYCGPRTHYQRAMRDGFQGTPPDTRLARHRTDIRHRFAELIRRSGEEGRLNITISSQTRRAHGLKKTAIRVLDPAQPAPTITSLPDDLLHYSEPRTLTVRETARLQSFPDWFAFRGNYTSGGLRRRHEVPRYTQVANAVPPLLAEQFGIALRKLLQSPPPTLSRSRAQT